MFYNYFLFYCTVGLSFATLQPVVLPVTALYFFIDCYMKKYLLLYVFVTKTESGGLYWRPVFNRCIFACIFANCVTALVVLARGTWSMVYTLVPLPIIMIIFKLYCRRQFADDMLYVCKKDSRLNIVDVENEAAGDKSSNERLRQLTTRFGHPVFYKQFMTPMVHAKAAEALETILEARRSDGTTDFADTVDHYSDIALHNLDSAGANQTNDAKRVSARKSAVAKGFELVNENQLDFAYFKERPEFREEFGGEGGMYGAVEDYMPDRAGTPSNAYFRGGNGRSTPGFADGNVPAPLFARTGTGMTNVSGATGYSRAGTPSNVNPYARGNAMGQQMQPPAPANIPSYRDIHGMAPTLPDIGMLSTPSPSPGPMGMRNLAAGSSGVSLNSAAGLLQHQDDYPSRGPSPAQHLLNHGTYGRPSDVDTLDFEEADLHGGSLAPATASTPLANEFDDRNRRSHAEFDDTQYQYGRGPGGYGGGHPGYSNNTPGRWY
ncbi:hypothetical protein KEM56_005773 [Ascosphaera pollenicola]|nr:hypothetical protein KEM56_005773 [Ascosphaera pollenicola]